MNIELTKEQAEQLKSDGEITIKLPEEKPVAGEIDWQRVIDEGYLVTVSDESQEDADRVTKHQEYWTRLNDYVEWGTRPFVTENIKGWKYCSIVREKGLIQPHFGGEQPVPRDTLVSYKMRNGTWLTRKAQDLNWDHEGSGSDIMQFIVLEEAE